MQIIKGKCVFITILRSRLGLLQVIKENMSKHNFRIQAESAQLALCEEPGLSTLPPVGEATVLVQTILNTLVFEYLIFDARE